MGLKLLNLDPQFIRYEEQYGRVIYHHVGEIQDAQGIRFCCPKCTHEGVEGVHWIICWSGERGVPPDAYPGPGRWRLKGTDYDDLTLEGEGGGSSIHVTTGCGYHGFLTNGECTL